MGSLGLESIWMDDPSIASVSPAYGGSTGIEGLQPGSTNLEGSWHSRDWVSDGWSLCFGSENENTTSCDTVVRPTLSGNTTIWWFNDYDSPDTNHYPTMTTLTASAEGSGSYTYRITSGSDKAGLGSDLASSYVTSSNQVDVTTRKGSSNENDVLITVERNGQTSAPFHMTVRAPDHLQLENIDYSGENTYGFLTTITYSVWDNLNTKLPYTIAANEYFTTAL
jgi:hypothetical protein